MLQHLVRCEHIAPAALDLAVTDAVLFQYFMPLIVTYLLHIRDLLSLILLLLKGCSLVSLCNYCTGLLVTFSAEKRSLLQVSC